MNEERIGKELDRKHGILRLRPNFVPQPYPGLDRIGIKNSKPRKRGYYSERWIASCIDATSESKSLNEGLSVIDLETSARAVFLRDALELCPDRILGKRYARANRRRLGISTNLLDIGYPIPLHLHARKKDAWKYWRLQPKEESYFFLRHPNALGPVPYSHLGLHHGTKTKDVLTCLKRWRDDKVLDLSPVYRLNADEGFHTLAGVPHAPGTALTLEVAEASDVYNHLQAKYMGKIQSKRLFLLRGLPNEEAVVKLINFKAARDPYYYKRFHTSPEPVTEQPEGPCVERWIYSPRKTRKFSGKELRVKPGAKIVCKEKAAHPLFVWSGKGLVQRTRVQAQPGQDELFITKEAAEAGYSIENTGNTWLIAYKTFGPNVYSRT